MNKKKLLFFLLFSCYFGHFTDIGVPLPEFNIDFPAFPQNSKINFKSALHNADAHFQILNNIFGKFDVAAIFVLLLFIFVTDRLDQIGLRLLLFAL